MSNTEHEPTEPGGEPDTEQPPAPDEDEDEAAGAQPPEPEPAEVAPQSQRDIEKRMQKLDAEADRHAKRVAEIMGDDFAMLVPSPLDWTPGFLWNPGAVALPDEVRGAVLALLGIEAEAELLDDPDAECCERCAGIGRLRTGSRAPQQDTRICTGCNGTGWKQKLHAVPTPAAVVPAIGVPTLPQPGAAPTGQPDAWGRQVGHPHYGIHPAQVVG